MPLYFVSLQGNFFLEENVLPAACLNSLFPKNVLMLAFFRSLSILPDQVVCHWLQKNKNNRLNFKF